MGTGWKAIALPTARQVKSRTRGEEYSTFMIQQTCAKGNVTIETISSLAVMRWSTGKKWATGDRDPRFNSC